MAMFELTLLCPEPTVEWVCDALEALDALSVSVEDADAQTPQEQALFGEPGMPAPREAWLHSCVRALFADRTLCEAAVATLPLHDAFAPCRILASTEVPEQDWVRLTQSQFAPVPVTPAFWVVPSWHQAPAEATTVIALDPGLAFGTGTHPTTRMCLRWIAAHPPQGLRVLDYGCGSGILAIGAAKFGAAEVHAVDIDPAAVTATEANAAANLVAVRAGDPQQVGGSYHVVLANILASPLKVLAPLLCAQLANGGTLVLAGILERQAQELRHAYAAYADLQQSDAEDGWILMTATR